MIAELVKEEGRLQFFGAISIEPALTPLLLVATIIAGSMEAGPWPRVPAAVLASAIATAGLTL